jgi:hypothetical protein
LLSHCTLIFYGLRKICARPAEFTTLGRTNYFFIVVVIRYDTAATAHWTLMFIVRAFINHTITVAVWTRFCSTMPWPKKLRNQGSGISSTGKIFMSFGTLT